MCGFSGILTFKHTDKLILQDNLKKMCSVISHRGPDASGFWVDEVNGIGLGHRRLSIIDLTSAGQQPMFSNSGRFIIAFNGEIYNYLELKNLLEMEVSEKWDSNRLSWRGNSDTEVLLNCIEKWGFEHTLNMTVGMFAFALWDRECQILYLARDRLGEKPIFYGSQKGALVFGSELKAIKNCSFFEKNLNQQAIEDYLSFGFIPAPQSIWSGIYKLPAATYLKFTNRNSFSPEKCVENLVNYWSPYHAVEKGSKNRFKGSLKEATYVLNNLIKQSITGQIISDKPIGAFLSGGIDSSLVVSSMVEQSSTPVKTFNIGFSETKFDESNQALKIAKYLKTDHHSFIVSSDFALNVFSSIPKIYDEPFADSSSVAALIVSKIAGKSVSVCLTGDGGDELFGGYERHYDKKTQLIWKILKNLPKNSRLTFAEILKITNTSLFLRKKYSSKIVMLRNIAQSQNSYDYYCCLVKQWDVSELICQNIFIKSEKTKRIFQSDISIQEAMMGYDLVSYMPENILVKIDRASMASGLETRAPFLDHRIVEFAQTLPLNMKVSGNKNKIILRSLLKQKLAIELIAPKKQGFDIPLEIWMKKDIKHWAESVLLSGSLKLCNINMGKVEKIWKSYLDTDKPNINKLWVLIMLSLWIENEQL